MLQVLNLGEKHRLKALPQEVQENISGIIEVSDLEYGKNRNFKDDGDYVIVIESDKDFE